MDEVELFPQKLKRLRDAAGLSPEQLAALTVKDGKFGISAQRIRQIEGGAGVVPEADKIEILASVLRVTASEFYEYPIAVARRDAAATPEAGRRRAADAARKAARRQSAPRPKPPADPAEIPRRGREA